MLQRLDEVLGSFGSHPRWAELKQMQTLRQLWPELVGEAVAAQTYPLSLRRQVLQVATSTPAWAQNLTLQRQIILSAFAGCKLKKWQHQALIIGNGHL